MVVLRDSGELESDEPIEESSFEELNCSYSSPSTTYSPPWEPANFPDFPPPPTYSPVWGPTSFPPSIPPFPLYLPASPPPPPSPSTSSLLHLQAGVDLFYNFENQHHEGVVDLKLFVEYLIEDRGGELNVINGLEGGTLNVVNMLENNVLYLLDVEINELEHQHEDIVDQLVIEYVRVDNCVIGYWGGKLDQISLGGVATINGVEYSRGQARSTTPELSVVFQDKISIRVWLGYHGQWVADIHYGWNWLNLGTFRTVENAPLAAKSVKRWRGGKDLFDKPFIIENRSESLQLPPTAQEENQDDGIGIKGTGDYAMADQAQFNSGCSEKRKTRKKNSRRERRNKKTSGVRIAIPLDDILRTKEMCLKAAANHFKVSISKLKSSCREYGILRWPPHNEHKLIRQSLPKETPVVVNQEGIPQLTSRTVPSNQALTANDDTNSVVEKEIPPLQFLPTAQPENPGAGFGNDEAEAIGVGVEGTREAAMEEAQLNSGCLGIKGKRKVNTLGEERDNNRTIGVRIAIPKEDILQTKQNYWS